MLDLPWDVEFKKEHGRWKVTVSNRTRSHKSDMIPHPVPQKTASHRTRSHKIEGETAPSPTFHRTRSHKIEGETAPSPTFHRTRSHK
jgi:hypothetical protein